MRILAVASQGGGMIFGHQADSQDGASNDQQPAGSPMGGGFIVGAQPDDISQAATPSTSPVTDVADTTDAAITQPLQLDTTALSDESDLAPVDSILQPDVIAQDPQTASTLPADDTDDDAVANVPNADLLVLKQQALSDLGPLVGQLDQTPEERFRTTMMMLQSTDNQALIKEAYAAAQAIPDEKVRAQALLDVINEINYFTQQSAKEA